MYKLAYPQDQFGTTIDSPYNLHKWMNTMKQIYEKSTSIGWNDAFKLLTGNWDNMEKLDFKHWMQFYQENAHEKYKTAQLLPRYVDNGIGSFIPVDAIKSTLPKAPDMAGFNQQQELDSAALKEEQERLRKELVTEKLRSLIGRLTSAEKLSTLPDVQRELNKVLPQGVRKWVASLQELKREIQLVPIHTATNDFINDVICKNANKLIISGDKESAKLLIKLAQAMPSTSGPMNDMGATPTMNPIDTNMGGQPMGPGDGPATNLGSGPLGMNPTGMENDPDPAKDKTMQEFLKLLSSPNDKSDISDINDNDELVVDESEVKKTAQTIPQDTPIEQTPEEIQEPIVENQVVQDPQLEVSENELNTPHEVIDPFDAALKDVKLDSVISRLEAIATLFKNREIARQLSIVDLMMDKLQIASFFPTMSECIKSALDSNNYCQTRVEDMLSKLRGVVPTQLSEHIQNEMVSENVARDNLAKQEVEEKNRKDRKKQLQQVEEDAAINKGMPEPTQEMAPINQVPPNKIPQPSIQNELAGPNNIEQAQPVRPTI